MKYMLVTGAASGIGKAITEAMARRGWFVFAADKNKEVLRSMSGKNIVPVYMDITKDKSVIDAYRKVAKETLYLDVIVNSAAIIEMSSLIEDDLSKIKKLMDVNLYGMIRVNNKFFPLLDKENGRIINISSECGWMSPVPFNGPYTISKYAVEAYNDTLRRELGFLGVKVIKIEPGSIKTNMHSEKVDSFKELIDNTKYYQNELKSMVNLIKDEFRHASNIKHVVNAIINASESENPKICYRVKNSDAKTRLNMLPEKSIDKYYLNTLK